MKQEIKYKGYTTSPSDYECLDGDMAVMSNIILEGGALRPISEPEIVQNFGARRPTRIWVRETPLFTHYIYPFGGNLYYREKGKEEDGDKVMCETGLANIFNLEIMGNTIIVITSEGLHYILWKADEDGNLGYVDLGNSIPECPISFGLQGLYVSKEVEISGSDTQAYLAQVNKFIADNSINGGQFIFPFLVRYAYRLYDGITLTHHSAPILMLPSTYEAPYLRPWSGAGANHLIEAFVARLDYQLLLSEDNYANILKWKDIIKSIDVFISAPIYSYDQNGEVDGTRSDRSDNVFVGRLGDDTRYGIHSYNVHISERRNLPMRDRFDVDKDVCSCSNFYFLKSIPLEELSRERTRIHIENDYLPSLVTREVMTDDYQSHDTLVAKYSQVYNGRLNISNIERKPFIGYDLASMVCYRNEGVTARATSQVIMPVDDGRAALEREASIGLTRGMNTYSYLYYPDSSAIGMNIIGASDYSLGAHFTPHTFLNGAVRFMGFPSVDGDISGDMYLSSDATIKNPTISVPNKIYTSEINNPFFFPVTGINSIGTGEIYGIRSAAKALSEGQMGQFPLYAFTSEGVWALGVNAQGGYNAIQPIIEDICLSPESIVQMDSSVAFASQRGIMILEGSNAACISNEINTEHPFNQENLPHLPYAPTPIIPFYDFLDNCKLLWDYFNQRLIVGGTTPYSYVYSLESKSWGIIDKGNYMAVRSYPNALAIDPYTGYLYDFSSHADSGNSVYAVSRPIKCDGADYLKQITSVIQRGMFRKGQISTILYGSRDMFSWHLVASSKDHILRGFRGTPYKYFRVVFMGELNGDESIAGCTIDFNIKYSNKTR